MSKRIKKKPRDKSILAEEYEYVENFGSIVRKARESMGLSQDELASLVKEKATVIRKIEQGELHPPIDLARRLEKTLKIRIIQETPEEIQPELTDMLKRNIPKETTYTLEDLLKKRKQEDETK